MPSAYFIRRSLLKRQSDAALILGAPAGTYKVCGVCNGIARAASRICPACHAYQFDESRIALLGACEAAGNTSFPTAPGYIPRSIHFAEVDTEGGPVHTV